MLNDRQTRFCDEYLANGGNAYQAALAAGYKENSAKQAASWISKTNKNQDKFYKPEMAAYIAEHSDAIEKHNSKIATAEEIQEFVSSVMKGEAHEVLLSMTGETVNVPANVKDRLKAADMMAKMKGLYTEKISAEINTPIVITGYDDVKE